MDLRKIVQRWTEDYIVGPVSWRVNAFTFACSDKTIPELEKRLKELEARGEIEPQEKRKGKDDVTQTIGVTIVTPEKSKEELLEESFQEWFSEHVVCGDAFNVMPALERKFDLAIVDPPYGITAEDWDLKNKLRYTSQSGCVKPGVMNSR